MSWLTYNCAEPDFPFMVCVTYYHKLSTYIIGRAVISHNNPVVPGSEAHLVKSEGDITEAELTMLKSHGRGGLTGAHEQLKLMIFQL